ncbi:syntaxin-3-like [Ochotona princeps]|uniref:syntaxin-3-like n=1 Tax=Ochotona princeps TaxID=9978 RepID=UPI0027155833|nr:syntaxin-3-like [Ochotona princeps]
MRDRLEELKSQVHRGKDPLELDDILVFDNLAFKESEVTSIEKFFQEVAELSLALTELEGLSVLIDKKQQGVLCCTTEESVLRKKNDLSIMKASFTSQARLIQPQLNTIRQELGTDCKYWRAEHRIRQSQLAALLGRFRGIINHHYACETEFVVRLKEKMMRQAELAGLKLREEDLEKLVASPVAPQIVGHDLDILKAKQDLALVQVRQQQLLDLECQVNELHTIFLQLEMLVSEQQELLDSIEYNILHAQDYIEQSNETVKKALKYKRQSRFLTVISAVIMDCALKNLCNIATVFLDNVNYRKYKVIDVYT